MRTLRIWKYILETVDWQEIEMPVQARILSLQEQNNVPVIWALVNPGNPRSLRKFHTFGTGHPINVDLGEFIGTYQIHGGSLVFHVFEEK